MSEKIPVTVLTGFLGSGKTTLLNRILSEQHGLRIAVIENEFGEIGIDQDLVINAEEEFFEMNNGCICCTVRGDLIRILGDLAKRKDKFDRVILETTGLADPGPVAQTFLVDVNIREQYNIDGIITLVDAKHVSNHLDEKTDEVLAQIAFADRIVLNKTDLVSEEELLKLEQRVKKVNKMAETYKATMADAPISELLDIGGFNLEHALEMNPKFLEPEYPFEWGGIWEIPAGKFTFQLQNGPDPDMTFLISEVDEVSEERVLKFAENVFVEFSNELKSLSHGQTIAESGVCYRLQLEGRDVYEFSYVSDKPKKIVVFSQHTPEEFQMKLLDDSTIEQGRAAEHYFSAGHEHDDNVTSLSFEFPGWFMEPNISIWFKCFLEKKGIDIYRMKGILAVKGAANSIVFQGVHMLFGTIEGKSWDTDKPVNRLVFIGRDLDEGYIRNSLQKCLETVND